MNNKDDIRLDLNVLYFHLAPESSCPYYLTLANYELENITPIMKDGHIIIYEEVEQTKQAFYLCDNKELFGSLPLQFEEDEPYDFPHLAKVILRKRIDNAHDVFKCAHILDDMIAILGISPPEEYEDIMSDIFLDFLETNDFGTFIKSKEYNRKDVLEAFRWHMRAVGERCLLLPMEGQLHKPKCNVENVLDYTKWGKKGRSMCQISS